MTRDKNLAELQTIRGKSRLHFAEYQFEGARGMLDQMRRFTDLKQKSILDLGCGHGGSSVYYGSQGLKVTAVDNYAYDSEALDCAKTFAKHKNVRVNFCIADAHCLPFDKGSFDVIRLDSVLEHLEYPTKTMAECHRVLKDRGLLFVTFPLFYSPFGGHTVDYIKIPWFHVLPSICVRRMLGFSRSNPGFFTNQYVEKLYMSLNRMTLKRFKKLLKLSNFKEIYFEEAFYMPHDVLLFIDKLKQAISARSPASLKNAFFHFHLSSVLIYIFLSLLYRFPLRSVSPFNELIVSGIRSVLMK